MREHIQAVYDSIHKEMKELDKLNKLKSLDHELEDKYDMLSLYFFNIRRYETILNKVSATNDRISELKDYET